jgi:PIN domain nuclease of toxin-antitoxin system
MRKGVPEVRQALLRDGLVEVEITASIAIDAGGLAGLSGDPMDRLIVATARERRATLLTADSAILSWHGDLQRMDATE